MKKGSFIIVLFIIVLTLGAEHLSAQCSICTKTAQQLGERPAKALNTGIIYLALAPITIFAVIGYRWWKSNRQ